MADGKSQIANRQLQIGTIVAVLILAGALAWFGFHTYHFATVQEGVLYRDGNHSIWDFKTAVRKGRIRTVVCLVDDAEMREKPFEQEEAFCRASGIELVRLPIRLGGWPTSEQVSRFLGIVTDKSREPVLVHCAQGVRRTGMMVAAYQESVLGYDAAKTRAAILSFGHSERTIADVQKFVELYDPKTRRLPATMPVTMPVTGPMMGPATGGE